MIRKPTSKKAAPPKRTGTAFWLADQDGTLLRAIAAAEDRTLQAVLRRALAAYAEGSREYQASRKGKV